MEIAERFGVLANELRTPLEAFVTFIGPSTVCSLRAEPVEVVA